VNYKERKPMTDKTFYVLVGFVMGNAVAWILVMLMIWLSNGRIKI
jgi:hypothetical protein